jgi:uncharacterized protein YbdZ (MbtH family)
MISITPQFPSLRFGTPPPAAARQRAGFRPIIFALRAFSVWPSNEYIPILAGAAPWRLIGGSAMAQEAFMKWNRIESGWKQLKDKFAIWPFRSSDDVSGSFGLIGGETSRFGHSDESQTAAFHPDDRGKRSEFSLHIGC